MQNQENRENQKKPTIAAVVLAGGRGKRMGSTIPKQYLQLNGFPLLYYSLKTFQESCVDQIALVCPQEDTYCKTEIVEKYGLDKVKYIVEGGAERYESVVCGLECVKNSDYVLIHDGARPFVTQEIIHRNIQEVLQKKACITAVPSKDTVKISNGQGAVSYTPLRENVWIVQTPQTFETALIYEAYQRILMQKDVSVTDDAMVVETVFHTPVYFVMGDYRNIKITTPEDLDVAKVYAQNFASKK